MIVDLAVQLSVSCEAVQFRSTAPGTYPVITPGELHPDCACDRQAAADLVALGVRECLEAHLAKLPGPPTLQAVSVARIA